MSDEKLTAVRARTSVGHGKKTWLCELQGRQAFIFKLITWTTTSCASWVASLNHEIFDHTVKNEAVIKTAVSQIQEIGHGDGRFFSEKSEINGAFGGGEFNSNVLHR